MENSVKVPITDNFSLDFRNNIDKLCGIPFLYIESLGISVQLLPVTKTQFEYFLCHQQDPEIGESVYLEILKRSPRVSPRKIDEKNYRNIFVTALTISQIKKYIDWLGEDYDLPTAEMWHEIYQVLNQSDEKSIINQIVKQPNIPQRSIDILQRLSVFSERNGIKLSDQLLFRYGIKELVTDKSSRSSYSFVGGKNINQSSHIAININALDLGIPDIGFRLIKR